MADSYYHARSSVKKWGGEPEDYLAIHQWFDASKHGFGDFRHRVLRHHTEGIASCIELFGPTLTLSTGRVIPTRYVAEQHVIEDMGRLVSLQDWCVCIQPQSWMNKPRQLSRELEREEEACPATPTSLTTVPTRHTGS